MKISKIDHTRSGYSILEYHRGEEEYQDHCGILYHTPVKDDNYPAMNLHEYIETRKQEVMEKYTLFSENISFPGEKEKRNEQYGKLLSSFHDGMLEILKKCVAEETDACVEKEIQELKQKSFEKSNFDISEEMIDKLLTNNLRKSLSRKDLKIENEKIAFADVLKRVLKALYIEGNLSEIDETELSAFFQILNKDFLREKQMQDIEKSIQNQGVRVDVVKKDNGKYYLRPANAEHPKKKYVFEFMARYCESEKAEKQALTQHIQRLILLYFYGAEGYLDETALTDKTFGEEEYLSPRIKDLVKQISEQKKLLEEQQQKINQEELSAVPLRKKKYAELTDEQKQQIDVIKLLKKEKNVIREKIQPLERKKRKAIEEAMAANYKTAVEYLCIEAKYTILGENSSRKNCSSADLFWLDYIDGVVEKLALKKSEKDMDYRLEKGYLCRHVWKEWTQYLASKYIDMGKATYHFVMPDLKKAPENEEVSFGEVNSDYHNGISGFEYERIKAKESLEREMAVYVSFAIHNFAQASADIKEREKSKHEDVLLMRTNSEKEAGKRKGKPIQLYPDANYRFLQFFGGKKRFEKNKDLLEAKDSSEKMFQAFRDEIYFVRNQNFHYTSGSHDEKPDHKLAEFFFQKDLSEIGEIFRKKYYSNNVHRYYEVQKINTLMDKLYQRKPKLVAQIPAFHHIISRPAITEQIGPMINASNLSLLKSNVDRTVIENYWSSLFFVLKEIYYYDFLADDELLKKRFWDALEKIKNETEKNKKKKHMQKSAENDAEATKRFEERIDEIGRDKSFGEICQGLMVEYHLQNNERKTVRKTFADKGSTQKTEDKFHIYKHYRTVLYLCIRQAFLDYLKESWEELKTPVYHEKKKEEKKGEKKEEKVFCEGYKISMYDYLAESFQKEDITATWYVTARFMNPKYLNHLIGGIRNYLQFTEDIEKRAGALYNRENPVYNEKKEEYEKILEILEFSIHFCGNTTNELSDYFKTDRTGLNSSEYAKFLSGILDYKSDTANTMVRDPETALYLFCMNSDEEQTKLNIYMDSDGKNIIPNRNIFLAKMYGNIERLKKSMDSITKTELVEFQKKKKELDSVLKEGICKDAKEQREFRKWQNAKNRIEFVDIAIYTELLNDLQGQLVNWVYLRERDLMYFQLGYYYMKLFWTNAIGIDDKRRKLEGENIHIENGAMLYQIVAMNSYHLPLIIEREGKLEFISSHQTIENAAESFRINFPEGKDIYFEGLDLFENTDEHDQIKDLRDYIDHFKYFAPKNSNVDRSMIDLYSKVYDIFFRYDIKLKKSVSVVLCNILARYFMALDLDMNGGEKRIGKSSKKQKKITDEKIHKATQFTIGEKRIVSTALTFHCIDAKKRKRTVLVNARSEKFLEQAARILESKS